MKVIVFVIIAYIIIVVIISITIQSVTEFSVRPELPYIQSWCLSTMAYA